MAILRKVDLSLWLAGPNASAGAAHAGRTQARAGGWSRFVVETDDLDALVASLKSAERCSAMTS